MFNLNKFPGIISHLKQVSSLFKPMGQTEYMMFCPYCGDEYRKTNPTHGHLYLAVDKPVFNCFRCGTYGTILKLLLDTGFDNEEELQYISKYVKVNIKSIYEVKKEYIKYEDIIDKYLKYINVFKAQNPKEFDKFEQYICERIGDVNYMYFGMLPYMYRSKYLSIAFYNYYNTLLGYRFINNKYRFKSIAHKDYYFFQNPIETINKNTEIVITEGNFDCINLFLYYDNNKFYIAGKGKNYISTIEFLLYNYIYFKKCNISIILDNDNLDKYKMYNYILNKYIGLINPEINFNFYHTIFKDAGEIVWLNKL